jgi:hypothetical protein
MRPLTSLTFDAVRCLLSRTFDQMPDRRAPERVRYSMHDTLVSAYAMFFFQFPSLLNYQQVMKQQRGRCNLETLFGVRELPSDTQMRDVLDGAPSDPLRRLLAVLFERVRRAGWGERLKTSLPEGDFYTLVLDGSDHLVSHKVECPLCLRQKDPNGMLYRHKVLCATLVKAASHEILPIDVEAIQNGDGQEKQDCERRAAHRVIARLRREHPKLSLVVCGDDLFACESIVALLAANRMRYVLVAKPSTHVELFRCVEAAEQWGLIERGQYEEGSGPKIKRRTVEYRIARAVPISAAREQYATLVEVWVRDVRGKLLYHNSWVTNLEVTAQTVATIARIGRSRWKIENEQFNVHKNGGYELEHNYGHGKNGLAFVLYVLNLLAFVTHQILEMGDRLYQQARSCDTLEELWNGLRMLMRKGLFETWKGMLEFWLDDSLPAKT